MGRNPWNVMNVGRPSVAGQSFLCIKGYTMEGNPLSSVTVGKSFITFDSFPAFSLEKWGKEYCYHPAELFDGTRAYISKHYIIILIYCY